MVKISTLSGVAAAALLLGVVGATAQGSRDSGAANTQPSGGGASSAQGASGSLGAGGEKSSGSAGTSAQTSQPRAGSGANTQPPGGGASSAQGAGGSLGESGRSGSSAQGSSSTQTGSSASSGGSGAVTLSSEEQTKLKSSIHNVNVKQANINVDVHTGTVLPTTVEAELEPIPAQIVEIVPRFRGYKIVRVKNEILIVEPSTRRVVYIIQS